MVLAWAVLWVHDTAANANPDGSETQDQAFEFIKTFVPQPIVIGEATHTNFFRKLYSVRLYAQSKGRRLSVPYALYFTYANAYSQEDLAQSIIQNMRRYRAVDELRLAAWYNTLLDAVSSVDVDDSLVAVATIDGSTIFYIARKSDGTGYVRSGMLSDPLFSDTFFAVWLGEDAPNSSMRDQLLAGLEDTNIPKQ